MDANQERVAALCIIVGCAAVFAFLFTLFDIACSLSSIAKTLRKRQEREEHYLRLKEKASKIWRGPHFEID